MSASFPKDPLDGSISGIAGTDQGEGDRDAGASPDNQGRSLDVVADTKFVIGLGKRLGVRLIRVHNDEGFGLNWTGSCPSIFVGILKISPTKRGGMAAVKGVLFLHGGRCYPGRAVLRVVLPSLPLAIPYRKRDARIKT